ncbi:MAG: hypothetical protein KC621_05350 [Myxococcales bacterium]|nr:hypothetical protein [Myxococcales bacterium]
MWTSLLACALTTANADPVDPNAVSWLEGCWIDDDFRASRNAGGDKGISECWKRKGDRLEGGWSDTRPDAHPAVQVMGFSPKDPLTLVVSVLSESEGGRTTIRSEQTPLRMIEANETTLVFTGPSDAYPSRLTYQRDGDRLTVHAEGRMGGSPRTLDVVLTRDRERELLEQALKEAFDKAGSKR